MASATEAIVHYPMPEYDITDMVGFFRQHMPQFRLSAEDLNSPKPETVCEIYRWFVQSLTKCKDGTIEQVRTEGQENYIEYPELHEFSVPLLKLTLSMDRIFDELGYSQFISIRDLVQPTKKRTNRVVSILMHYYAFVKSRESFVSGCMHKAKEISDERETFIKRNNELKERIQSIRIEKAKHEPELNKLKDRKANLSKKLKEERKKAQNLVKDDEILTNQENFLKGSLEQVRSLKETLEVKDKMLANQIISSPDKLSAELDELKRQKIEKEQQLEIFHANIRELGEKQKEFPRFEALLDNLLLSLNKIAQEISKRDELAKKKEDLGETIGNLNLRLDDKSRTLNGRREVLASRKEQVTKFKQQLNLRLVDYQKEIAKCKEQIHKLEREINESEVVASAFDEQCRNLRKEVNKMEREHEELVARCNEKHENLMGALDKMNNKAFQFYDDVDVNMVDVNVNDVGAASGDEN